MARACGGWDDFRSCHRISMGPLDGEEVACIMQSPTKNLQVLERLPSPTSFPRNQATISFFFFLVELIQVIQNKEYFKLRAHMKISGHIKVLHVAHI